MVKSHTDLTNLTATKSGYVYIYVSNESPVIVFFDNLLFIDFTGKKLQIVDVNTGEVQEVEVFVAILGCSQYTFVMAVASQKKEDFIEACQAALHFYGGVPEVIVPDNLRSAVKKASRYEAELNDSFAAFAAHYSTYIFPARAYKPKDKALVEGAVKIIYTTIFTKIDEKVHTSLATLNADIVFIYKRIMICCLPDVITADYSNLSCWKEMY